jgi:ADP-ribose pyrophosphatase
MQELFNGHGWRVTLEDGVFPDGRIKQVAQVHRCDSVHIVAVPAPGRVLLLREYRPILKEWVWMLPSGKMDKAGEADPLVAAQRELQEETGFRAARLEPLLISRPAETIDQCNHLFVATDLSPAPLACDDDELMEVHDLTLDEAIANVFARQPVHSLSVIGLLAYARQYP